MRQLPLLLALALTAAPALAAPAAGWPHGAEQDTPAADDGLAEPLDDPSADERTAFLAWQRAQAAKLAADWPDGHPEPAYRFAAELYGAVAPLVAERPGVIRPFRVGRTVQGRPIWGFRVSRPTDEIRSKILVFAGIHAMEWIPGEVATSFLEALARHPAPNVEVVVIPVLNLDGRMKVERDMKRPAPRPYRRANARGVDLNRDFAWNRESDAIWKAIVPGYYTTSPGPLSQPESQALDRLAAEGFDVSVSLHAFGGYVYWPWSGRWDPPPDRETFHALGRVMVSGMPGAPYQNKQLSHWGFFFRALGTELDHMYAEYGTYSFLIELTRSGIEPLDPKTWKDYFRWYNPKDPTKDRADGTGALRALVHHASWNGLPPRPTPPVRP